MCTVIAAYNSDGCIGRCDAKCYNAIGEECHCICRGANHGVGRKQAIQNTNELVDQWVEAYEVEHQVTLWTIESVQASLSGFDDDIR